MSGTEADREALASLHADLPATYDLRFLNYAATAPMLAAAAETMVTVARENLRPLSEHFPVWLERLERARREIAEAVGARTDEITFTTGTSAALSLVAGAVHWRAGDRVLYPADEFPSNRYTWDNLRDRGVEAEAIPVEPGVPFDAQLARTDLSGVRLVAFSAVSFRDGRRHPVERIAALCRARGILTCVDAIQAVGAIPVSMRAWDCDFAACGGQKWLLGPVGSGFLFVRAELLESLHVPTAGWASSRHAGDHDVTQLVFADGAARFEGGLPDVAAIAALGASVRRLAAAEWPRVHARVAALRARLVGGLRALGLEPLHDGPEEGTAGIVTVAVDDTRAAALAETLARNQVVATFRPRELRLSAHATTSDDDVDVCLAAIARALERAAPERARVEVGGSNTAGAPAAPGSVRGWTHAVVTGASRGLGEAIATALAARGTALTLLGRDAPALARLAERLREAHGGEVCAVPLDLADSGAIERWLADARGSLEDADLLVNNAVEAEAAPFLELDDRRVRAAFGTNVFAPMVLTRALLPAMLERRRGTVLNVVTTGARNALPLFSSYAASKGALWAWSESLARELDGTGVRIVAFLPPIMDTTTRNRLARRAVGWYDARGHHGTTPVTRVAAMVLDAAASGALSVAPRSSRWQIALNALSPAWVERGIRRRWRAKPTA